ncbi:hypothetical protein ABH926_003652 [Catenulispora sp. GP43]|uniref:hypothetical protein n=1 Tax=Catenulispora sp. GP43 TaxID=3156263 RepID=UPI0035198BC5
MFTDHALLSDLNRLLMVKGASAEDADRIVKTVAATRNPGAVRTLLLASARGRAWVAAGDGYAHYWKKGVLLTEDPAQPRWFRAEFLRQDLGGAQYVSIHTYRYTRPGGRTVLVADGAPVKVGDVLTSGPFYLGDTLWIWGKTAAITAATGRLMQATSLDTSEAEQVVRPLFDGVEVIEAGPDLPPGARLTAGAVVAYETFMDENRAAYERGKRDGGNYISMGRRVFLSVAKALAVAEHVRG